jgi:ribonuclease HI
VTPAPHTSGDAEPAEVVRLERHLLDPAVRRDAAAVLALLHPDFAEVGASGRRWDGASVAHAVAEAADDPPADSGDEPGVEVRDVEAFRLSDDVVLVTYRAHGPDRVSWRSSVWVRTHGSWLLRYHQGTPTG